MATVLVVDDRPLNRDLVRTILGYEGHHVVEADSGEQALDLLALEAPDVMISDVLMPGMDGYELARAVRSTPGGTALPIVFYTANYVEREARPIAAACGVAHVVAKDGDPRALIDAVAQALRAGPARAVPVPEADFSREHLRVLNDKLLDKVRELEEKERLTRIVEAAVTVGGDIAGVPTTLRRIAGAARGLVAARFCSLVVVDANGVEIGAATDGVAFGSGETPDDDATISVPLELRDGLSGTLEILGRHTGAAFTTTDRDTVAGFARAAAPAISNAYRYDDARRRHAWLSASTDAVAKLLAADADEALAMVVRNARMVANADIAWIEVVGARVADEPGSLAAAVGGRLLEEVAASGEPVVLADATLGVDESCGPVADLAGIGPLLAVPLKSTRKLLGVLILGNRRYRSGFTALDVEMATAFAGHAAVALEFARADSDRGRLRVLEERERIARDLHDVVIQRLFAVGLGLEGMAKRLPSRAARHVHEATGELDNTIADIRRVIAALRGGQGDDDLTLSERLGPVFGRAERMLGFRPVIHLDAALDEAVPAALHLDLVATVNEALANAARHARADAVEVTIVVEGGELVAIVADDGVGLPPKRQESGLANLRKRAELAGGYLTTTAGRDGVGHVLTWRVPLRR